MRKKPLMTPKPLKIPQSTRNSTQRINRNRKRRCEKAAKQAADTAKEAIDAATNVEGVNTAKTEGLPKVNAEVNGAIKSNAKQDIDTAAEKAKEPSTTLTYQKTSKQSKRRSRESQRSR
ncbi:hypothetical protein H1220_01950 [Carnobacteriaceae bacterium zg-84]|nr:hypothetical protein H1220_01950 [Carnobacteriaceae bacterium zg-84]